MKQSLAVLPRAAFKKREAARILGVSEVTLDKIIRSQRLRAFPANADLCPDLTGGPGGIHRRSRHYVVSRALRDSDKPTLPDRMPPPHKEKT
jgi:hypothetical protein